MATHTCLASFRLLRNKGIFLEMDEKSLAVITALVVLIILLALAFILRKVYHQVDEDDEEREKMHPTD